MCMLLGEASRVVNCEVLFVDCARLVVRLCAAVALSFHVGGTATFTEAKLQAAHLNSKLLNHGLPQGGAAKIALSE